jgi:UDP-glucose 4-epimerase
MKNKRILVTGGNGYLGRHLVEKLQQMQAEVFIMDLYGTDNQHSLILDITDIKAVKKGIDKIKPQLVFHLAASLDRNRSFDNFDQIYAINTKGTHNLLEALKGHNYENFIFTSTSEVYGDNTPPFKETQLPQPASPYSLTKVFSENLITTFSKTYQKKYTILRLFNFFGKNMSPQFFIPQMIETLRDSQKFEMTEGEQKRDFLYLDDIVQALILAAEKPAQNEIFNVCSAKAVSLKELILEVKNSLNSQSEILFGTLPYRENEVWNMLGDNTKIINKLGFKPIFNLKAGIKEIIG